MEYDNEKQFFDDLKLLGASIEKFELFYPQMKEQLIPLANTGISARTFIHWRKLGIIDYQETISETRSWVRLNLFQYLWLKVCSTMRDFGIPLQILLEAKQEYLKDIYSDIQDIDKTEYNAYLEEISNLTKEQIEAHLRALDFLKEAYPHLPDEDKIFYTPFAMLISRVLLCNDDVSIVLINNNGDFVFNDISIQMMDEFKISPLELLTQIHLNLPLRRFLEDFIDEPRNNKHINYFGLINMAEKRVLDAIRNKSYKEIAIRFGNEREDMIIEGFSDGDILASKAKEVQRILGMNEYDEITLKFRNDKHIYYKNKKRISN